jgi:IS30 family transposase
MERRSRYVCLVRVTGKETQTVVRTLTRRVQRLPTGLMATLTWDRGLELAAHRTFSIATGVQVYFCDPRSPWQRGTNENTNGACCDSTSLGVRTCLATASGISMRLRDALTPDLARHSAIGRRRIYS